jgi:hypothetical protein
MKLQLLQNTKPSPKNLDHREEMERLYERLTTNPFGDSEPVRQTILRRMIYLTFHCLPKY